MTLTERKQAAYAMKRQAWRQNYLSQDASSWQQVANTFHSQSRQYAAQGEYRLAIIAKNHADTFSAIAFQIKSETLS